MEQLAKARDKRQYLEDTKKLKNGLEEGFIHLGERLYKIKEERVWEIDHRSYAEFLMEIRVSEGTASKLVAIYKRFVLEYDMPYEKLAECSWNSLYQLLPLATTKDKAEELIDDAASLKRGDVEEKVREVNHPDCAHEDTYKLVVCRDCGYRHSEPDDE